MDINKLITLFCIYASVPNKNPYIMVDNALPAKIISILILPKDTVNHVLKEWFLTPKLKCANVHKINRFSIKRVPVPQINHSILKTNNVLAVSILISGISCSCSVRHVLMVIDILSYKENASKCYVQAILCSKILLIPVPVARYNLIWFNLLYVHNVR